MLQAFSFLLTISANAVHMPVFEFSGALCHLYIIFQFQYLSASYSLFLSHCFYYIKTFSRMVEKWESPSHLRKNISAFQLEILDILNTCQICFQNAL